MLDWLGLLQVKGKLESWIATIAPKLAIDYLRSASGKKTSPLTNTSDTASFLIPSPVAQLEREDFVLVASRSLNAAQRQIVDLVYFRGFTLEERATTYFTNQGGLQRATLEMLSSMERGL